MCVYAALIPHRITSSESTICSASFPATMRETNGGFDLCSPDPAIGSRLRCDPAPDEHDLTGCRLRWTLNVAARSESRVCISVEPVVDGQAVGLPLSCEDDPIDAIAVRQLLAWQAMAPQIVSTDPRLSRALDQSLADLAALRIVDRGHPERVVVAAGAPWFMTLFGRDSLLTSWMTLPFDAQLASGVLLSLAELQGTAVDPVAEEQPGKILHELRRHGGGGPFAARSRYYGTVDATPLFIALAAEAWQWGALSDAIIVQLAPAVDAALAWLLGDGDSDGDGFIDYHRREASGLSNQGWKDSWDGITRVDGTVPASPIALVEVQGYAYAALNGAAELADVMPLRHTAVELRKRAMDLRERFNGTFWDERGWFVLGLDRDGRPIDSLTTNPGHALWSGIADDRLAHRYLDRLMEPTMWTGWGLRTLAEPMAAYDPISYHNGSVWPHDTAICAAGAAHYGRWDVVDRIVDGALDAAMHFDGRPPELFAGIARNDVPVPVAYPSSCSPQAWSSASVLLLLRSMLGLTISADRSRPVLERTDLRGVPEMVLDRLSFAGRPLTVRVREGRSEVGDR